MSAALTVNDDCDCDGDGDSLGAGCELLDEAAESALVNAVSASATCCSSRSTACCAASSVVPAAVQESPDDGSGSGAPVGVEVGSGDAPESVGVVLGVLCVEAAHASSAAFSAALACESAWSVSCCALRTAAWSLTRLPGPLEDGSGVRTTCGCASCKVGPEDCAAAPELCPDSSEDIRLRAEARVDRADLSSLRNSERFSRAITCPACTC